MTELSFARLSPARSDLTATRLTDLDFSASLFLWAFRGYALDGQTTACVKGTFVFHLGASGPEILRHILVIAQILGQTGQRKISLNLPRSERLSRDEAALLRALHAAQTGREAGLTAQLHWLAAGAPITPLARATCVVAGGFASAGLHVPNVKTI